MISRFVRLVSDERGAALAEYVLLVVLVAIVALLAVALTGDEVSETYSVIANSVESAAA